MRYLLTLALCLGACTHESTLETHVDAAMGTDSAPPDTNHVDRTPTVHTLEHGGLARTYLLHVPENLPSNAPLLVAVHGYATQASFVKSLSGLDDVADEEGFVVIYPQGTEDHEGQEFFNVGYDVHEDQTVDDLDFITTLVDNLVTEYTLNPDAVFVTGMSVGGDMAYRIACEADWVRAVAPVAGTLREEDLPRCTPDPAVPILAINGTADLLTWYNGDPDNATGWGAYLSVDDAVQFWAEAYDLELRDRMLLPDLVTTDNTVVELSRWESATSEGAFWLYKVEGGGHDWPGVTGNRDIHAARVIWDFFSRYL